MILYYRPVTSRRQSRASNQTQVGLVSQIPALSELRVYLLLGSLSTSEQINLDFNLSLCLCPTLALLTQGEEVKGQVM